MNPETIAVHAGRAVDPASGAVTPDLTLSSTFARLPDGQLAAGFNYGRYDNPNRRSLETALAALEGGIEALAFASGQAATAAIFQTLPRGARVVLPDDLYHGTRALAHLFRESHQLQLEFVDLSSADKVSATLSRPAQLLWIETPSNPQLKITDLAAAAKAGRAAGALVVADNTWATPILTRPLSLGAQVAMHSSTKYFGGHSDVIGGALILGADAPAGLGAKLREWQRLGGAVPAPFDCWLLLRSLSTLPIRVRAQSATAAQLAAWLAKQPGVEKVFHPSLASHAGHAVAQRQMAAGGAMISFLVRGGAEAARRVAGRLQLITRATSLGGVESLVEHRKPIEGPDSLTPDNLLRLSVGLEHVDDLVADLQQALG